MTSRYRVTAVGTKNKPWVLTKEDAMRVVLLMDDDGHVYRVYRVESHVQLDSERVKARIRELRKATNKAFTLCEVTDVVMIPSVGGLNASLESSAKLKHLRPMFNIEVAGTTRWTNATSPREAEEEAKVPRRIGFTLCSRHGRVWAAKGECPQCAEGRDASQDKTAADETVDTHISLMVSKLQEARSGYQKGMPTEGVYHAFVEVTERMLAMVLKTMNATMRKAVTSPVETLPTKGVPTRAEQAKQGAAKPSSDPKGWKTPKRTATTAGNTGAEKNTLPPKGAAAKATFRADPTKGKVPKGR